MTNVHSVGAVLSLTLCLGVAPLGAQSVPTTLNYQGRLLQNTGDQEAVSGTVDIIFGLWSGPAEDSSAVELWSEAWSDVALSNGIFSVLLGSNGSPLDPADFQGDTSLYLELEVEGEVLQPRQQLGSAPFAIVDEPGNELQDLELSGNTLGLTGSAATIDLSPYLDDSEPQDLSLTATTLSLTGDATAVDLSPFLDDTDEQTLSLAGVTLAITGSGSSVDLSGFLDNTDSQALSLSGSTLGISGSGSSIDLSGFLDDTDQQTLALAGDALTISNSGSSVDLSSATTVADLANRIAAAEAELRRTVFVTSQTYDGSLGGLAGADAACQALADAASLDGTFLAWLSDSTDSPSTRFVRDSRDYVLVDGTEIADGWSDLNDGTIDNPIDVTETGATLAGSMGVWTATAFAGTATADHCNDWTTNTTPPVGRIGFIDATDATWTDSFNSFGCNGSFHLYCFEQPNSFPADNQELLLTGTDLQLTSDDGPDVVSLAGFLDDTDEQTLSLAGNTLAISGSGSSVDLSGYLDDTDAQNLSNVLTLGNSAGNLTITDLATPAAAGDAATKGYVDAAVSGGGSGLVVIAPPATQEATTTNHLVDLELLGTTNLGTSGTSDLLSLGANGSYLNHWFGTTVNRDQERFRVDNAGGILSLGEFGLGSLPVSGAGTRLMWVPRSAAFRAGHVDGTRWDDHEIGLYSAAFGYNSRASGDYSFAAGYNTWARDNALAMGRWATASGVNSVALGHGAHANSRKGAFIFADSFYDLYCEPGSSNDDPGCGASEDTTFRASINNSFNVRATGGVYLWTDADKTRGLSFRHTALSVVASLVMENSALRMLATGEMQITSNSAGTAGVSLAAGDGSWTMLSDRNLKENFVGVDGEDVLSRLRGLPVTTWNYKAQDRSVRHMGPVAQDFRAAFGLGDTDRGITTVDVGGVALAGVKALDARTAAQTARLDTLEAGLRAPESERHNAEQRERIAMLERELREAKAERESLARRLKRLEELLLGSAAGAGEYAQGRAGAGAQ